MAFTVQRLPDESIIIIKVSHPLEKNVEAETIASDNAVAEAAKDIQGRYFRIADMVDLNMTFHQISTWLATQRGGRSGSISDPRIRTITVAGTQTAKDTAEWAKQKQYGGIQIDIFETMDEALAFARSEIAAGRL